MELDWQKVYQRQPGNLSARVYRAETGKIAKKYGRLFQISSTFKFNPHDLNNVDET